MRNEFRLDTETAEEEDIHISQLPPSFKSLAEEVRVIRMKFRLARVWSILRVRL